MFGISACLSTSTGQFPQHIILTVINVKSTSHIDVGQYMLLE